MTGMQPGAPSDRYSIDRYVRDLQALVGHLPPFDSSACEQTFMRAVRDLPEARSPVTHWTIRGLTVVALMQIGGDRTGSVPDWEARLQQVWLSTSTAELQVAVERLLAALRTCHAAPRMDQRTVAALAYMRTHLHDCGMSLDDISAGVRLSRWYVGRLLLRDTGSTYRALLRQMRVERATELLRDPRVSVKEVAAAVGYRYATELTRDFKRSLRVTPTAWRRHCRDRAAAVVASAVATSSRELPRIHPLRAGHRPPVDRQAS